MQFSIGEFSKLHITLPSAVIGLALIMPVFYFDIYLFNYPFFKSQPFYLVLTLSYVLSLSWLLASLILSANMGRIINERTKLNKISPISVFYGVYGLIVIHLIMYFVNGLKCSFHAYIIWLILCSLAMHIVYGLSFAYRKSEEKSKKDTSSTFENKMNS